MKQKTIWELIKFCDGSNPYVCKTQSEFQKLSRKHPLKRIDKNVWLAYIKEIEVRNDTTRF